jgi:hypothetical protein
MSPFDEKMAPFVVLAAPFVKFPARRVDLIQPFLAPAGLISPD